MNSQVFHLEIPIYILVSLQNIFEELVRSLAVVIRSRQSEKQPIVDELALIAIRGDPGITGYLTIYGLSCLQFAH